MQNLGYSHHSPRRSHGLSLGPLHPAASLDAASGRAASDGTASTQGTPGVQSTASHHSLVSIQGSPHGVGSTPSPASFEFGPLQIKAQHEATAKLTQPRHAQHASRNDVQRQTAPAVGSQSAVAPAVGSQAGVAPAVDSQAGVAPLMPASQALGTPSLQVIALVSASGLQSIAQQ